MRDLLEDYGLGIDVASREVEDVAIVPEFFDSISGERPDRAAVIATHWSESVAMSGGHWGTVSRSNALHEERRSR